MDKYVEQSQWELPKSPQPAHKIPWTENIKDWKISRGKIADMFAIFLLFCRYLLAAGLGEKASPQNRGLGLMQYGLCYIVHQTIKCGFSEAAVCPTHLFLL